MTALREFHDYEARLRYSTSAFLCFHLARGTFLSLIRLWMDFLPYLPLWFSFLFDFRYNRKYESITVS